MRLFAAILALAAFSASASVSAETPEKHLGSPTEFVQSFYDWYVPLALRAERQPGPSAERAIKMRPQLFSPQLRHALQADFDAQNKVRGYIVGIDFDPFLGAQDIEDRYVAGDAHQWGSVWRVNVYGVVSGKRDAQPSTEISVQHQDGHWVITDFQYKDNADLLETLKSLKNERKKH